MAKIGISSAVVVCAELEAVERQAGFEAQRVARAQAGRRSPAGHQRVPQPGGGLGGDEELEAQRLAGVARATHAHGRAGRGELRELVAQRLGQSAPLRGARQDVARPRALQGDHGDLAGRVAQLEVAVRRRFATEVLPVGDTVGGVDDQKVLSAREAVEVGVVEGATGLVGDDRVLRLADLERGRVVGEDALQEGQGVGPADQEPAHVGDVEQAGLPAGGEVLGDDAAGVVDGHLPAGEVDHPPGGRQVLVVQDGALQVSHAGHPPPVAWRPSPRPRYARPRSSAR